MDVKLVGQRIKERRLELGVTLQEIANEIDVNKSTIQRYENGKIKDIKTPVINLIADYLNVNPLWIMGKADHKTFSEEYEFATHLMNLNFRSIVNWSNDQIFNEKETVIIRSHFHDLLGRYKQIIEGYSQAKLRWKSSQESYKKLYEERLSDIEIKELFLKNELEHQLNNTTEWINAFPNWIARNEEVDE